MVIHGISVVTNNIVKKFMTCKYKIFGTMIYGWIHDNRWSISFSFIEVHPPDCFGNKQTKFGCLLIRKGKGLVRILTLHSIFCLCNHWGGGDSKWNSQKSVSNFWAVPHVFLLQGCLIVVKFNMGATSINVLALLLAQNNANSHLGP